MGNTETPAREKAIELRDKFFKVKGRSPYSAMDKHMAVECAIITVNEIQLSSLNQYWNYWEDVKEQLNLL